jgi:membrane fusion protein (multidrug efflux system)
MVGARFDSDWLIEEGLKVGERIIVEGLQKVREGAVVVPMTAAEITQKAAATAPSETIKEKE